jgi:hypothetical protein
MSRREAGVNRNRPRWAYDPTGRHELRYWDGERWTHHVADGGVQASDDWSHDLGEPRSLVDRDAGTWIVASVALVAMVVLSGAAIATNIPEMDGCIPRHGRWLWACVIAILLIGAGALAWYRRQASAQGPRTAIFAAIVVVFTLSVVVPTFWWLVTFKGDVGHC